MSESVKKSRLQSKTEIVHIIFTITNRLELTLSQASVYFSSLVSKPNEREQNDLRNIYRGKQG